MWSAIKNKILCEHIIVITQHKFGRIGVGGTEETWGDQFGGLRNYEKDHFGCGLYI